MIYSNCIYCLKERIFNLSVLFLLARSLVRVDYGLASCVFAPQSGSLSQLYCTIREFDFLLVSRLLIFIFERQLNKVVTESDCRPFYSFVDYVCSIGDCNLRC